MKRIALLLLVFSAYSFATEPHFDVVSVKELVFQGGRRSGGPGTSDPERFTFTGPLSDLISQAYGVKLKQIIAPKGAPLLQPATPTAIELAATMPRDTTKEQFHVMLQNMLAERFHLIVHHESRDFPAYEITVDKNGPKFHEDDPDTTPAGTSAGDSGSSTGPKFQLRNKPISVFLEQLTGAMASIVHRQDPSAPVPQLVDKTGLTGRYSFSVPFSYRTPEDSPDTPVSFANVLGTVQRELGLKVTKGKDVPVDMIVVDSVDPHASAN